MRREDEDLPRVIHGVEDHEAAQGHGAPDKNASFAGFPLAHVAPVLPQSGREQRARPDLTVPHPRAHLRRFVLEPLAEIAPDLRAPGWPGTVTDLLQGLDTSESLARMTG